VWVMYFHVLYIIVENKIMFKQFHPFTSINPCFPSKNPKPGTDLAQKKKPPMKRIISG